MVVDDPVCRRRRRSPSAVNTIGASPGRWRSLRDVAMARPAVQPAVTTGLAVASGGAAWWLLTVPGAHPRVAGALACALAYWRCRRFGTRVPQDLLAAPHELVDYREGREANLAVIRRQGGLQLEIDRWWQGQDRKTHQVLAAHVPLLLHAAPRRVLVVGVGAGQTPASILTHDIERLDCVEIEPAVFDPDGTASYSV
jgi:spermidine synthase